MINLIVLGAAGRMGQNILNFAAKDKDINIIGAVDAPTCKQLGNNPLCNDTGFARDYSNLKITSSLKDLIKQCDVIIDFTHPDVTISNLDLIINEKKSLVIGTTGFSVEQKFEIAEAGKKTACVFAPNMSLGVNIFFKLLQQAALKLRDYETEIIEYHHNKKKDSPSGTALYAADIIAKATDRTEDSFVYGRKGLVGERSIDEIGIHAVRAGDIVGEHTVMFTGNNERLEITHRAHNRNNFTAGAVLAAKWLKDKSIGLYDMWDVLEIKE